MAERTALVIGASMAGLMAARSLSKHFANVILIERDELEDNTEPRNGAPQGRHIHALLLQGQTLLESMFPGLTTELTESGSPLMMWCRESVYFTAGGWIKRFNSGIQTNVIVRPDLELRVRRRLIAGGKVTILNGRDVKNLLTTPDRSRVIGVEVSVRGTQTVETLYADLVVDASGRVSKSPEWLKALGYDAPTETNVNSYVGYATRFYQKPQREVDWKVLFINARSSENNPRGGAIFDVGHGQWMVSLGGMNKEYPPTDDTGFMEFARKLPSPTLAEALAQATPISPIVGYRITGSRMRHYEKLARRPEAFIVLGDAACAFNPLYGQGITVAAMEAVDLDKQLSQHGSADLTGFAEKFQKAIAKTLQNAWLLSTGEDLRYPGTEGDRPTALARLMQRYVDAYLRVSHLDEALTLAFIKVLNLSAPPTVLFAPSLVWRVIRLTLQQRNAPQMSVASDRNVIPAVE